MKLFLLVISMLWVSAGFAAEKPAAPPAASLSGKVLEVRQVDNFTYLRLKTKDGETWAATTRTRTFFFTVNLLDRRGNLLTEHIDQLRSAFMAARRRRPFTIEAIVILPDQLHCIWTLPSGDADFSTRWHDINARFAAQIPPREKLSVGVAGVGRESEAHPAFGSGNRRLQKGERDIWQRRFWEHVIRDERDYERHVDYIHYNPVKHGHVTRVADWPHSSFYSYVERGIYNLEWAANDNVRSLEME